MRLIRQITHLLAIVSIGIPIYAQNDIVRFEHLSIKDGLSQSSVMCILKDSRGFMWFGSQDGLNRYDGYGFKIYSSTNESSSISNNLINALCEDKFGNIWIGTYNGLNRLNVKNGSINRILEINGSKIKKINVIFKDRSDNIYIGHEFGIAKLIFDENEDPEFLPEDLVQSRYSELSDRNVQAIFDDDNGYLWIGTADYGLYRYSKELLNEPPLHFTTTGNVYGKLSDNSVSSITSDSGGNLWVGTDNGLTRIDLRSYSTQQFQNDPNDPNSLAGNKIANVYNAPRSGLWVGTYENGVSHYITATESFKNYTYDPFDDYSLSDFNLIKGLLEDETGVLWVGTLLGGVNKFDNTKIKFNYYSGDQSNPKLFVNNSIRSIHKDEVGNVWIGTVNNGVYYYNNETKVYQNLVHIPGNENSLQDNQIRSVLVSKNGQVWVGLRKKGVCRIDMRGNKMSFTRYNHDINNPASLPYDQISRIIEDNDNNIWILHYNGMLSKYNSSSNSFEVHIEGVISKSNVESPTCTVDDQNRIWVGTNINFSCYDPKSRSVVKEYRYDPEVINGLPRSNIRSISQSGNPSIFWLGSNNGLVRFDAKTETFKIYDTTYGLANNTVYAAFETNEGKIWSSTNKGLSVFDPENESFENFDISDGLQSNEFNNNAYFQSSKGELLFGGLNGYNAFYPEEIQYNAYYPKIVITEFQIFNKEVKIRGPKNPNSPLTKNIIITDSLVLDYEDNVISFEFAALHYSEPGNNKYEYKLLGFDSDWNQTSADKRRVTYTNLDPGEYTLKIRASNNDGIWNPEAKSVFLEIVPPFWMTNWFRILLLILVGSVVVLIVRIRVHNINRQKRILTERVEARTAQILNHQKEIEKKAEELKRAKILLQNKNEELFALNNSLEQKVQVRTEELNKAINELDHYIDKTTHDLRGPISSLLGLNEIIHNDVFDEKAIYYFKIYNQQVKKIDKIILDLLELAKVKDIEIKYSEINFEQLVDNCIKGLDYLPNFDNIDFRINIDGGFKVFSDENLLQSIIQSLVENGIVYSKKSGESFISIDIKNIDDQLFIKVSDNGIGIHEKFHEKVYDMFFRGNNNVPGTGLGMHIFKKAVGKLNGEVKLKSKVNEGTTFEILLPIYIQSTEPKWNI